MPNESGTWIMRGIPADDPRCIHTPDQLLSYINQIGFLPLFMNEIPGFSVEELTVPDHWWTGDPAHDPWEWRQILAGGGQVAYGKFFNKKAGFISLNWLPRFINYRRDGYDFDALWDDGKASYRQKKIMDLFTDDAELFSFDAKAQAGFGKGGEKNFDGVITDLQMNLYLCIRDFRKKTNKSGREYGWPIAIYATPEHIWGYDTVTSAYREDPMESGRKIITHVQEHFPEATETKIRKALGRGILPR